MVGDGFVREDTAKVLEFLSLVIHDLGQALGS